MPKVRKYAERDIQLAIQDISNGISQNAAADKHGIPRSTLQGRLKGAGTRQEAKELQMKLSYEHEEALATWARIQDGLGLPLTHNVLRAAAERML